MSISTWCAPILRTCARWRPILLCAVLAGAGALAGASLGTLPVVGQIAGASLSVTPPRKHVDVVFVVDLHDGMREELRGIAEGVEEFAAELARLGHTGRVGLESFQTGSAAAETQTVQPLTADVAPLQAELRKLTAPPRQVGGLTSALEALLSASEQSWEPSAERVLVLITDARPADSAIETRLAETAIAKLQQAGINQVQFVVGETAFPMSRQFHQTLAGGETRLDEKPERRQHFAWVMPQIAHGIVQEFHRPAPQVRGRRATLIHGIAAGLLAACAAVGLVLGGRCLSRESVVWRPMELAVIVALLAGCVLVGAGWGSIGNSSISDGSSRTLLASLVECGLVGLLLGWIGRTVIPRVSQRGSPWIGLGAGLAAALVSSAVAARSTAVSHRLTDAALLGSFAGLALALSPLAVGVRFSTRNRLEKPGLSLRLPSNRKLPLDIGSTLTARDLPGLSIPGSAPVAQVIRNPSAPEILGLQNLTDRSWTIINPQGQQKQVEPGRSVQLAARTQVDFGGIRGEIC